MHASSIICSWGHDVTITTTMQADLRIDWMSVAMEIIPVQLSHNPSQPDNSVTVMRTAGIITVWVAYCIDLLSWRCRLLTMSQIIAYKRLLVFLPILLLKFITLLSAARGQNLRHCTQRRCSKSFHVGYSSTLRQTPMNIRIHVHTEQRKQRRVMWVSASSRCSACDDRTCPQSRVYCCPVQANCVFQPCMACMILAAEPRRRRHSACTFEVCTTWKRQKWVTATCRRYTERSERKTAIFTLLWFSWELHICVVL